MHPVFNTWLKISASVSYLTTCGLAYFLVSTFWRHPVVYLYLTAYVHSKVFLRHLIVCTTTTKVSLWFVARLNMNLVFHLKFPFTSSYLGSEYLSHIFNTLCIILKLFPLHPLKLRNVEQGSEKFLRDFDPYTFSKSYLSGEWKMTFNICFVAILLY